MKYKITKEQYTNVVNKIIKTVFIDVEPIWDEGEERIDLFIGNQNQIGAIRFGRNPMKERNCKVELAFHTDTILTLKDFAPIFRKKLFAKLMIDYFSKLASIKIDCFWMDDDEDISDESIFTYKIKKKKNKK